MTRDMSRHEFLAAVKRRGWKQELMWVTGIGKEGYTTGVGIVLTKKRGDWKTNYRATLAKAIRELKETEQ